ncbi:NAD(P)H-binding protein [Rhizobium mesosinicum]|uniref:NAD(P)H-binding protein n=1 Tax=Rhizobium mesosinicum TaxID=335017 RepID=A0ABS7GSS4_9HYPH|nr:NAD(P)H-binding protein [Rhizobium mesosinicum]MBW9052969.1 NAD(P)H-binding protein [Rhizobium mesosinicum]
MLIVTGASGKLGRKIVENLLRHVSAREIGVSVRDPNKVLDMEASGVRVRRGDYSDAASLRHAWAGAKRLLLISSNAAATGGNPLEQHANAIGVAREIGVKRIFYTSQVSSSATSYFPPGRDHAATEAMLAESGIAWTAMRHGFYAASALMMNKRGFDAGKLEGPEDGKVAWATHDDLAAADARLLVGDEVMDGPTAPLTGSESLDLADLAIIAGELLCKPISRSIASEESVKANAQAAGISDGTIAVMLGYYRAARAGEFAATDPTLARILGRAPETMRTFLKTNL